MNTLEYKTFLTAIQIKPVRQIMNGERFIPDYVVFDSHWLKKNCVSLKIAEMGLNHVIFTAAMKK